MKPDSWKLWDDDASAVANGTPFRVSYIMRGLFKSLYFHTKEEAFAFAQNHPEPSIDCIIHCESNETLFYSHL